MTKVGVVTCALSVVSVLTLPLSLQNHHFGSPLLSYDDLLMRLAVDCEGFSGAALAGVARAAASHALERAVEEFSDQLQESPPGAPSGTVSSIMDCLVTQDDFYDAITDLQNSMGTHDHSDDADEGEQDVSTSPK